MKRPTVFGLGEYGAMLLALDEIAEELERFLAERKMLSSIWGTKQ